MTWQPGHYPRLPERVAILERGVERLEKTAERLEEQLARAARAGWIVVLELALLGIAGAGAALYALIGG